MAARRTNVEWLAAALGIAEKKARAILESKDRAQARTEVKALSGRLTEAQRADILRRIDRVWLEGRQLRTTQITQFEGMILSTAGSTAESPRPPDPQIDAVGDEDGPDPDEVALEIDPRGRGEGGAAILTGARAEAAVNIVAGGLDKDS
jgi:hypothetical protein